jgi:hypothetical protein
MTGHPWFEVPLMLWRALRESRFGWGASGHSLAWHAGRRVAGALRVGPPAARPVPRRVPGMGRPAA